MISRGLQYMAAGLGVAIFIAAMIYPAGALLVRAVQEGPASLAIAAEAGEQAFSWTLLQRSVLLAAGAALLSVVLSLPGAYALGRLAGRRGDALTVALLLAPVLFPAMIYAFGWQRLLPQLHESCTVWVWASWSWPIPALLIGAGWSRQGRRLYEEALLFMKPATAFLRAVLPVLSGYVSVGFLLLFAYFLGEYSVPSACSTVVYATALLSQADTARNPAAVLIASGPVVVVIVLALVGAFWFWRRRSREALDDASHAGRLRIAGLVPMGLVLLCVAVPYYGLARKEPFIEAFRNTIGIYGLELVESLAIALAAGAIVLLMGACLSSIRRLRIATLAWALVWAAMPGALVGEAVVLGYITVPAIYDNWPLMVIGYIARFGWIGILVAWMAHDNVGEETVDAARIDGAGPFTIAWRIAFAGNWPVLACGTLVVAALCLSEVATTSLVRVPSVNPIATILLEKFHRFEDGILTAASLLLMLAAVPGALLASLVARTWHGRPAR